MSSFSYISFACRIIVGKGGCLLGDTVWPAGDDDAQFCKRPFIEDILAKDSTGSMVHSIAKIFCLRK